MAEILDLNKISSILDINVTDNTIIKQIEENFTKYKSLPKFGPLLLTIGINRDNQYSEVIAFNAAIQLKNYINSYWRYGNDEKENQQLSFDNEKIIVISEEDKNFIRSQILEGVVYIVDKENISILKQFNQCVKKILKFDYKMKWKADFVQAIIKCFDSKNQKQIYAGIMLLYQLSKLFEYEDAENQKIYNEVLIKINDKLLFFLNECKKLNNNVEAMVVYKLIKIFFKSFQSEIPETFQNKDIFNNWSEFMVLMLKFQLNQQYIEDKKNIFWKLKHICFQTLTRIVQKYSNLSVKKKSEFQKILEAKYIENYYDLFKVIYTNYNNNQGYVDDYGKSYIYSFFTFLLNKKAFKDKIIQLFIENDNLLEEIIKDCFMTKEDLETWVNDPKNYIAQKAEEISMYTSKRYRALKLITALLECIDKKTKKYSCYDKIFSFLCKSLINDKQNLEQEINNVKNNFLRNEDYLLSPNKIPHILYKESIIFIIKNNAEIIIKKSNGTDIETLIEQYIYPELNSPCGLLREQSCDLISKFGSMPFNNNQLLKNIIVSLCKLMEIDPQLSVKLYASLAIGALFDKQITKELLKGNIKKIFEINLKLMDETDIEEIMDNLQEIVKYFTEESQQYIVQLSNYLIKYFEKIKSKESDEENAMDNYSLISNIVTTFCNFIQYFINNNNIYPSIENNIDILLEYCLQNSYDRLEEGLDIIEAILKYGNTIPNHVWKFYVPLVESVIGSEEELKEFKKEFPNQIFTGNGYESILDIVKLVCNLIAKEPNIFIGMEVKTGVTYFDYAIKLIESIISISESKSSFTEIKYSLRIISTLFDCYKGKIDMLLKHIIKYILLKYKDNKNKDLENYLQNLLSICFIYDPLKTLNEFQNEHCTKEIFIFWFKGLDNLKKVIDMKYNLIGICSLISLDQNQQDKLIIDNMNQIFQKIYAITENISKKTREKEEDKDNDDDNFGNFGIDEDFEEGENNMDEMLKKIIDNPGGDDDDDLSYEEEDDDDKPLTNFEKQSAILFVKNTLAAISEKSPDIKNIIIQTLGDKLKNLEEMFNIEEKRIANNK